MKYFINILRILLGAIFIASGLLKLYPIELLELSIAETGVFSWTQSMLVSRLLIGFEIFLGIMIISGSFKKLVWSVTILTLIGFSVYLCFIIIFMPGLNDCGCMGIQIQITPIHSIYKNLALIAVSTFIWIFESRYKGKWLNDYISGKWVLITATVISFSLPFILNPLSIERDKLLEKTPLLTNTIELSDEPFLTWHSNDTLQISNGKKIVCFFSPSCRFCQMAARKIRVIQQNSPEPFSLYFVFAGNSQSREKLASFFTQTMTETVPTAIIEANKFFSISGKSLPIIFYVDGNTIVDRDNFMTLTEDRVQKFFD